VSTAARAEPRRSAVSGDAETVSRILDGAYEAVVRRGLNKVSMSNIGESAGVSRGTLYRYFASKDEVLGALPDFILLRWEQDLRAAVASHPEPEDRLRVVMEAIIGYADQAPEALRLIQQEPELGLAMLRRNLPQTVRVVAELLAPVIEDAAVVRHRVVTGPELAEIILRIAMSGFLVPGTRTRQLAKRVANVWDFMSSTGSADEHTADVPSDRIAEVAPLSRGRRERRA
jgi:AcrR family transcriptional regulator